MEADAWVDSQYLPASLVVNFYSALEMVFEVEPMMPFRTTLRSDSACHLFLNSLEACGRCSIVVFLSSSKSKPVLRYPEQP